MKGICKVQIYSDRREYHALVVRAIRREYIQRAQQVDPERCRMYNAL